MRPFAARSVWLALFASVAVAQAPPSAAAKRRLPNIVILYADDLGYGDVRAFDPNCRIPTPNLDRLARAGLICTNAHASSGICSPSRYSLLTGRHHWRQFHAIVPIFGPSVLPPGRLTIADLLRARGYATACIGKWHLGWDWNALERADAEPVLVDGKPNGYPADAFDWSRPIPDGPIAHGFDHYFGCDVPNFPPYAWIRDDRIVIAPTLPFSAQPATAAEGTLDCRPGPMAAGWQLDAVMPTLVEHAVEWIDERAKGQRPFFLYLPFTSPHTPIVPSAKFQGSSGLGGYGDYVVQTDAAVGAVLDALDRHQLADDTLVIFASDNGPEHFAFERVRASGHHSMGPLRGLKRDVWEGGHRTPFIVRWPGVVRPSTTSDALVCQTDVMATLAAITGQDLPNDAGEDSFDLLPLWRGEGGSGRAFLVHNTFANRWAIRRGDRVLIDGPSGSGTVMPDWFVAQEGYDDPAGATARLFDLRADLGQRHDRSADEPKVVEELGQLLQRIRAGGRTAPERRPAASDTLDLAARLQPLGEAQRFAVPGWFVWGGSPIRGEDGRCYLFYSRWPEGTVGRAPGDETLFAGMRGWLKYSEIAVAVADAPTGPYRHLTTLLRGSGDPQRWDRHNAHNPHVRRFGDKVYLYFIATNPVEHADAWLGYANGQRIGVATADSVADLVAGRYTPSATPLLAPDGERTFSRAVNPSVARTKDGDYLMMFKTVGAAPPGKPDGGTMAMWIARAARPDGPFVQVAPVLQGAGVVAEDAFLWYDEDRERFYAIVKDFNRSGTLSPQFGALALLTSENGVDDWRPARNRLVAYREYRSANGGLRPLFHLERPQLLFDQDGRPQCLHAAAADVLPSSGTPTFHLVLPVR